MNINQNIVRIRTSKQIGSGIIYPCETNKKFNYKPSYISFTNRHLVEGLIGIDNNKDLKKMIDFDIYDQDGQLISNEMIEDISLFTNKNAADNIEDIVAFMIILNAKVKIDLVTKIMWSEPEENIIFMQGFPKVLYNNEVSSKIQLQGESKEIFPVNKKFGIFQITDDYHWYSNIKDLFLFQGFSGGPVFNKKNNTVYILGLNKSILNIDNGENPFKLLYFYKINFVLQYLREHGCIIYRRNEDESVSIRWLNYE